MNPKRKGLLIILAVVIMFSLACNLSSAAGGAAPTSNGGSSSSGVDQESFTGGPSLPIIRKDKNSFNTSQFIASSLPVEVVFLGDLNADVVFKGALAELNYNLSETPPKKLDIFVVLQKDSPSILYQEGEYIKADKWVMDWKTDLLDSGGNIVSSVEYKRFKSLFAGYPQAYKVYFEKIPENTTSARVTISMINEKLPLSCISSAGTGFCATAADLNFKIPSPIFYHTPVLLSLKLGTWNETYAKKAVMGEFTYKYRNPFNRKMDFYTTLLFLDDSGSLVGYFEDEQYLDPNAIYNRNQYGDFFHTAYFSAVPTKALVYDTTKLSDLIQAVR